MLKKIIIFQFCILLIIGLSACPKKPVQVPLPKTTEKPAEKSVEPEIELSNEPVETPVQEEPSVRELGFDIAPNVSPVYFDFDKSDINTEQQKVLQVNSESLLKSTGTKVLIEGHTCECGTNEYNLGLAQKRALSIRNYYIKLGINAGRIATISYGKEKPVNINAGPPDSPACALNRRAETKIQK